MSLTYRLAFACAVACTCVLVPSPGAVHARSAPAKPPALVIVLGASGSMLEPVASTAKTSLASDVLAKLVDGLPDSSEVGLIAYGHRSKDKCDDVQQLVPLVPLDKPSFAAQVARLVPRGKNPLTAATRRAIDLARPRAGLTTVVLISDGLESCGASPCELVEQAKAAGVNFVLHVVGYDLAAADAEPLRCAAEAGGGRYFAAGNAAELGAALEESVSAVRVPTGLLTVSASSDGKPIEANAEVRAAGSAKSLGRKQVNLGGGDAPVTFRLPGGAYELRVTPGQRGLAPYQASFDLVAGRQAAQAATFGAGQLNLTVTHNGAAMQRAPSVTLRRAGERKTLHVNANALRKTGSRPEQGLFELPLASGTYDIEVTTQELARTAQRTVRAVIEAGKTAASRCDFESGSLGVRATHGGQAIGATIVVRGGERPISAVTSAAAPTKTLVLPPGKYELEVTANGIAPALRGGATEPKLRASKRLEISVRARDQLQHDVEL